MNKRIGIIGSNSVEFVSILLNIWNDGNCALLLDWKIPSYSAISLLNEAKVELCYIDDELKLFYKIADFPNIMIIFYKKTKLKVTFLPCAILNKYKANYSKKEAVVIYSSGTTGKSRGIILSHYALTTNCDLIQRYMCLSKNDTLYIVKPFNHSSTLTGELLIALKYKIKLLIGPVVIPPRCILNNILNYNISTICVNPAILQFIVDEYKTNKYELVLLKTIYVSGDILSDKLYLDAHKIFKFINIYNVYGTSETGPRISAQQPTCSKSNSVGKALNDIEIVIVNEEGLLVNHGEKGLVHVNTPCLYMGYISGDIKNISFYKKWFNTGDIGFFDDNFELHIVGRCDDVIIINSHKIYPAEVEKKIMKIEEIVECIVIKYKYGEQDILACAYVSNSDILNIKSKIVKFLISYEIPKKFFKVNYIPKNKNGKINRKETFKLINKFIK